MKNYLDDKSKVIERIRTFRKLRGPSLLRFIDAVTGAYEVARIVEGQTRVKLIRSQARKNLIINLVTCLEVLLKEIIQENKGNWNQEGLNSLLKEKISLTDAFELFKSYRPDKEDLISMSTSFQNIQTIDAIFGKLTNRNFLHEVGQYTYVFTQEQKQLFARNEDLVFNRDIPSWKNILKQLYDYRHTFVHEATYKTEVDIEISLVMLLVLQLGPAFWATTVYKKF